MPTTPHPLTGETIPVTLGHEFSGVIEETGEGVNDMRVGDRVVVQPIIYDGTCGACKEGLVNCCYSGGFIGLSGKFSLERSQGRFLKLKGCRIRRRIVRSYSRASSQRNPNTRLGFDGGWR